MVGSAYCTSFFCTRYSFCLKKFNLLHQGWQVKCCNENPILLKYDGVSKQIQFMPKFITFYRLIYLA